MDENKYLCTINNIISIMDKVINRIKAVLAEKKRTNMWLAEQLGGVIILRIAQKYGIYRFQKAHR